MQKNNKIFIIWGDIDNEISWPSIGVKNLIDWFKDNNIKFEIVKWFKIKELLKLIKIPFYKNIYLNWIQNYNIIYYLSKLFPNKKFIIWPNFFPHNSILKLKNCLFLAPSNWYKRYLLENYIFFNNNLKIFKFPISNTILNFKSNKKWPILIYYKNLIKTNETSKTIENKKIILNQIKDYFDENHIKYKLFIYWQYKHNEWINYLKTTKMIVFITGTETQSIAKYEAMNFDIPILNYQQNIRFSNNTNTLIKYWNTLPDIDEKIYWKDFIDFKSFLKQYNYLIENYDKYNPKSYIVENFSSKVLAKKLVDLFNNL